MVRRLLLVTLLLSGSAASAFFGSGVDRNIKLNGPLAPRPAGDVLGYRLTPDSTRAVFLAESGENEAQLLSVPVDGSGAQLQLNADLPPGRLVTEFHLTPDGTRAVYRADQDVDDQYELYSVPVDGSQAPLKISGSLLAERDVRGIFAISPDGSRVVYRADADTDQVNEFFGAPVDGSSPPVKLSGTLAPGQVVQPDLVVTPDSSRVVYRSQTDDVYELFSTPIDGTGVPDLLDDTGYLELLEVAPDSSRVVFCSFRDTPGVREVFSVPVDGSAPAVKLNGPLPNAGDVWQFDISSDSTRVVYAADQDINFVQELYSVPLDGSATPIKLNAPFSAGSYVIDFEIAPDASRVAFRASILSVVNEALFSAPLDGSAAAIQLTGYGVEDSFRVSGDATHVLYRQWTGSDHQLFGVDLDGSTSPFQLSDPISLNKSVLEFVLSPDGQLAVFQVGFSNYELYAVPVDGSAPPVLVHAFGASFLTAEGLQITPDNASLVFRADEQQNDLLQLFAVPTDGSQLALELTDPLYGVILGRVITFKLSPDGQWAVYMAWGETYGVGQLYVAPVDGSAPPVELSGPFQPDGDVRDFWISADSSRVVYVADQDEDNVFELYGVPVDGSAPPIELNDPLGPSGTVAIGGTLFNPPELSPDSSRVVYETDQETNGLFEIYSAPLDGSGSPVKLNSTLPVGASAPAFSISTDSARVVYVAQQDALGTSELYSVPIDGSATPVKLNGALIPGGNLLSFAISQDASRVIYTADQETDQQIELYSVPVDGSAAPVKLSGVLPAGGDVFLPGAVVARISDDSSRVVYLADERVNDVFELYSVGIDGANPVRLTSNPVSGGDVTEFAISPDSNGVVFLGDVLTNGVEELLYAPIDGSNAAVRIHGPFVDLGAIRSWQISPDSSRVVYNADAEQNTWWRLYSVPIQGGAAVRINGTLPFQGDVQTDFQISPDSKYVLYRADQEIDEQMELYAVPIDGRTAAPRSVKVNGTLVQGGDTLLVGYTLTSDSSRVVYMADQEIDAVTELFATDLVPEVTGVSPDRGSMTGGNTVTLHGCGFTEQTEVFFGGKPATSVTYVDASELRVVVPPNRRFPTQTGGTPTGRTRRAVLQDLEVDIRVSEAGIGSILEASYSYVPSIRR